MKIQSNLSLIHYLRTTNCITEPGNPFIMADAFKWHRPCSTIPLTYILKKNWANKKMHTALLKEIHELDSTVYNKVRIEFHTSRISSPISNPPEDDAIPFGLIPAIKHAILLRSRCPANEIPILLLFPLSIVWHNTVPKFPYRFFILSVCYYHVFIYFLVALHVK